MVRSKEVKTEEIKGLLQPNRLDILLLLYEQDTCVCQMVKKLKLKHNLISHHLKTLQDMEYVFSKRNGTHMIYSLNEEKKGTVKSLFNILNI